MKVYTACSEHGLILLFTFVCAGTLDEYWYPEQIIASTLQWKKLSALSWTVMSI